MSAAWQVEWLDPTRDAARIDALRANGADWRDLSAALTAEWHALGEARPPERRVAWFPWRNRLLGLLDAAAMRRVRLDRNRNHLTHAELNRLGRLRIGIVGLSVGQAIARLLATVGCVGELRLADFDTLALSNLNRVPGSLFDIGENKAIMAARAVAELDPDVRLVVLPDGIEAHTVDAFLDGLDVLIEECDALDWKVRIREMARARGICTLMATSDRGLFDVERFDLEPHRPVLHGLLGDVRADALVGLSADEKVPFALGILDGARISPRLAASLIEIDHGLNTWPQLGSEVALGAVQVVHAVCRIGLDRPLPSGRLRLDLDAHLPKEPLAPSPLEAPAPRPIQTGGSLAERLAIAARSAPSAANVQPWRFGMTSAGFVLSRDPSRRAGSLDIADRASLVALGAAVECAVIAAQATGHAPAVRWQSADLAVIELPPGEPPSDAEARCEAMFARCTDRRPGTGRSCTAAQAQALEALAPDQVRVITDRDTLTAFGALSGQADRLRLTHPRLHAELCRELRWRPAADGIEAHTLGMTPVEWARMQVITRPEVVACTRRWGGGAALHTAARDAMASASGLILITLPPGRRDRLAYAQAGRLVQRVWMAAQSLGFGVHPMTPITAYAQSDAELATALTGPDLACAATLRAAFSALLGDAPMVIPLRLISVDGPAPRSGRRALSTFWVE